MTNTPPIERITRSLAKMLRHAPEEFDVELDRFGFADCREVVQVLNECIGQPVDEEDLAEAIEAGDRPRYSIEDGRIRALYGHSIEVDPGEPEKPQELLYVGLGSRDAERAERYGLRAGRRSFLHLAKDFEEARETGRRQARTYVVVTVYALDAWEQGVNFYDRGALYLSDPIPTEFLEAGEVHDDGTPPRRDGDRGRDRRGPRGGGRSRDGGRRERGRRGGRDGESRGRRRDEEEEAPRRSGEGRGERSEREGRRERDGRDDRQRDGRQRGGRGRDGEERGGRRPRRERDERPRESTESKAPAREAREEEVQSRKPAAPASGFGAGVSEPKPTPIKEVPQPPRSKKPEPEPEPAPEPAPETTTEIPPSPEPEEPSRGGPSFGSGI